MLSGSTIIWSGSARKSNARVCINSRRAGGVRNDRMVRSSEDRGEGRHGAGARDPGSDGACEGSYAVFEDLRRDFIYLNDIAFARFSDAVLLQASVSKAQAQLYRIISLANADDLQQAKVQLGAAERLFAESGGARQGPAAGFG